ncbi:uncharacterized protein LOC124719820 [Schistocerca piceifrons]|uniref:uncharacterized protein LOC124719820 n=1 Tax=Schistocerca piceifrons TaxID=274613 RepID=UPI001F5EA2BB|nr:uncharacterized protein LOC124719820 [Schistocerca piceifrons]
MTLNVQCLKNKYCELEIAVSNTQPDVLCITEHWCKDQEICSIHINPFKLANHYSRKIAKGGVVSIYLRQELEFKKRCEAENLSIEKFFETGAVQLYGLMKKVIVITVYRSPCGNKEVFFDKLELLLNTIYKKETVIILCGDFNINLLVESQQKRQFLDILKSFSMSPHINNSTRITNTSNSLIDNIFSNMSATDIEVTNIDLGLCDHNALTTEIPLRSKEDKGVSNIYKRNFSVVSCHQFISILKNENWLDVMKQPSTDEAYSVFASIYMMNFEMCFPKKLTRIKSTGHIKSSSWMTLGIKKSCENMKKLNSELRECTDTDFIEYVKRYRKIYRRTLSKNFGEQIKLEAPKAASSMMAVPTNKKEVLKVIKSLKFKMSAGVDEVPIILVKKTANQIAKPLAHIAILSMAEGVNQDKMKTNTDFHNYDTRQCKDLHIQAVTRTRSQKHIDLYEFSTDTNFVVVVVKMHPNKSYITNVINGIIIDK